MTSPQLNRTLTLIIIEKLDNSRYIRRTIDRLPSFTNLINQYTSSTDILDRRKRLLEENIQATYLTIDEEDTVNRHAFFIVNLLHAFLSQNTDIIQSQVEYGEWIRLSGQYKDTNFDCRYKMEDENLNLEITISNGTYPGFDLNDISSTLLLYTDEGLTSSLLELNLYYRLSDFYYKNQRNQGL